MNAPRSKMTSPLPTARPRTALLLVALASAAMVAVPTPAQQRVDQSALLDANQLVGSGGRNNRINGQVNFNLGNDIVTGNVTGGREFRDSVGYGSAGSFRGATSDQALGGFRRETFNQGGPAGRTVRYFDSFDSVQQSPGNFAGSDPFTIAGRDRVFTQADTIGGSLKPSVVGSAPSGGAFNGDASIGEFIGEDGEVQQLEQSLLAGIRRVQRAGVDEELRGGLNLDLLDQIQTGLPEAPTGSQYAPGDEEDRYGIYRRGGNDRSLGSMSRTEARAFIAAAARAARAAQADESGSGAFVDMVLPGMSPTVAIGSELKRQAMLSGQIDADQEENLSVLGKALIAQRVGAQGEDPADLTGLSAYNQLMETLNSGQLPAGRWGSEGMTTDEIVARLGGEAGASAGEEGSDADAMPGGLGALPGLGAADGSDSISFEGGTAESTAREDVAGAPAMERDPFAMQELPEMPLRDFLRAPSEAEVNEAESLREQAIAKLYQLESLGQGQQPNRLLAELTENFSELLNTDDFGVENTRDFEIDTTNEGRVEALPEISEQMDQLMRSLDYELPALQTLAGSRDDRINNALREAEAELAAGNYFTAQRLYQQVLVESGQPRPLARVGLVHSQLGGGMVRSSALQLRRLFEDHPELIAARYEAQLMPAGPRLRQVEADLRKLINQPESGADASIMMAYLGYQIGSPQMIRYGLAVAESQAPDDALLPVLRRVWLDEMPEAPTRTLTQPDAPEPGDVQP